MGAGRGGGGGGGGGGSVGSGDGGLERGSSLTASKSADGSKGVGWGEGGGKREGNLKIASKEACVDATRWPGVWGLKGLAFKVQRVGVVWMRCTGQVFRVRVQSLEFRSCVDARFRVQGFRFRV